MRAVTVWWDLSASSQTIESLRGYLAGESVAAFAQVPGLRFKMWISDSATNRWGAVLLLSRRRRPGSRCPAGPRS